MPESDDLKKTFDSGIIDFTGIVVYTVQCFGEMKEMSRFVSGEKNGSLRGGKKDRRRAAGTKKTAKKRTVFCNFQPESDYGIPGSAAGSWALGAVFIA